MTTDQSRQSQGGQTGPGSANQKTRLGHIDQSEANTGVMSVCEWRWWGWLSLSIKVKSGLWPEYWDCATQPGWVWSQLQDTNSLSVSRQLFQTGWRRRDSSLGEVARQINSKYKYLVLTVKQQCNVIICTIHSYRKRVFISKYFCPKLSHIILVEKSNAFPKAISIKILETSYRFKCDLWIKSRYH